MQVKPCNDCKLKGMCRIRDDIINWGRRGWWSEYDEIAKIFSKVGAKPKALVLTCSRFHQGSRWWEALLTKLRISIGSKLVGSGWKLRVKNGARLWVPRKCTQ